VKDQRTFTIEDLCNSQAETGNDFYFLTHSPRLCSRRVSTHRPWIDVSPLVSFIEQRRLLAEDQFKSYNTKKRKQYAPQRKMRRLLECWSGWREWTGSLMRRDRVDEKTEDLPLRSGRHRSGKG
jgi:hypothetical protein